MCYYSLLQHRNHYCGGLQILYAGERSVSVSLFLILYLLSFSFILSFFFVLPPLSSFSSPQHLSEVSTAGVNEATKSVWDEVGCVWMYPSPPSLPHRQVALADVVLINKTDLVSRTQLADIRTRITAINSLAKLQDTVKSKIDLGCILDLHAYDSAGRYACT